MARQHNHCGEHHCSPGSGHVNFCQSAAVAKYLDVGFHNDYIIVRSEKIFDIQFLDSVRNIHQKMKYNFVPKSATRLDLHAIVRAAL